MPHHRLVEQFGSTRRKRQMTSKELAAVDPDSIRAPLCFLLLLPCLLRLDPSAAVQPQALSAHTAVTAAAVEDLAPLCTKDLSFEPHRGTTPWFAVFPASCLWCRTNNTEQVTELRTRRASGGRESSHQQSFSFESFYLVKIAFSISANSPVAGRQAALCTFTCISEPFNREPRAGDGAVGCGARARSCRRQSSLE